MLPLGDCFAFACRATDPQSLGDLTNRITPINNLRDRIAYELVRKPILLTHLMSLLASKITKQGVYKSRGYSLIKTYTYG